MINNNRQQNGRRRGRGGQRQGGGGNPGNNSRIDNRARGNAAQLLEKYKNLASEAQRQGDRVNTEYYLQFADHYFRVVSEQRGRFEEQDRQRRDAQGQQDGDQFDDDAGYDDGDDQDNRGSDNRGQDSRDAQPQREPREANREGRNGRERFRRDREERGAELPAGAAFASEGEPAPATEQQGGDPAVAERPRRGRPPRQAQRQPQAEVDTFDIDRLPPSFAPANDGPNEGGDGVDPADDTAAKPRRRRLRPAGEATSAG